MSASIVTFANFGRKKNLRTLDMLPLAEKLTAAGELKQIICQINAGYKFPKTYSAIPPAIRYPLRAYEKITKRPFSRETMDGLFDSFGAHKLARADVTFLHGAFFMPNIVRRARKIGSKTVDISVSAYIPSNAELERREFELLKITNYTGTYTRLLETMPPLSDIDYMILMSDYTEKTFLAAGYPKDHLFTAYVDIDTARFSPNTDKKNDVFRLVYTGFTTPLKGLHYLLDAWTSLDLPNAELVLVGGYGAIPMELRNRYEAIFAKNPTIKWVGVSQEPEKYCRDASAFVFPSLTEGFGRSVLEAMACGIPVITTENARAIVEDGKTGFVVPIRSSQALADKIKYLYDHQDIREQMGKAARIAVENKKPFGEAAFEIYKKIMEKENKL